MIATALRAAFDLGHRTGETIPARGAVVAVVIIAAPQSSTARRDQPRRPPAYAPLTCRQSPTAMALSADHAAAEVRGQEVRHAAVVLDQHHLQLRRGGRPQARMRRAHDGVEARRQAVDAVGAVGRRGRRARAGPRQPWMRIPTPSRPASSTSTTPSSSRSCQTRPPIAPPGGSSPTSIRAAKPIAVPAATTKRTVRGKLSSPGVHIASSLAKANRNDAPTPISPLSASSTVTSGGRSCTKVRFTGSGYARARVDHREVDHQRAEVGVVALDLAADPERPRRRIGQVEIRPRSRTRRSSRRRRCRRARGWCRHSANRAGSPDRRRRSRRGRPPRTEKRESTWRVDGIHACS